MAAEPALAVDLVELYRRMCLVRAFEENVGASVPLAVGAGLSSRVLGQERVAVGFFGDGAVNQGAFHEAVNLAAIWSLPVLLVCENNTYAEFTDSREMTRRAGVAALGPA